MPDCLKELVDYKNSQDYLMFKQLHMQLNSKYSRIKAYPQPHKTMPSLNQHT